MDGRKNSRRSNSNNKNSNKSTHKSDINMKSSNKMKSNSKKNSNSKQKNNSKKSSNSMRNRNSRQNNQSNKNKRTVGQVIKLGLKLFILFGLLGITIAILWFYQTYGKTLLDMQSEAKKRVGASTAETFRASETSLVYDVDGLLISTLKAEKDVYYIAYENIPLEAIEAIVATEDKKFMQHDGVDYLANIRAAIALIKNKGEITQGASTITQQLARNVFLSNEVSYERKVREIFIAQELEKKYSKPDIMEFYFNNIYFANGHYGIMAAANAYFSEGVSNLSLSQLVFLCSIPNSPNLYNPLTNMKNTLSRRDRVLRIMLEDGKISRQEYDNAIKEKIVLKQPKTKKKDYVETFAYYSAIRALMEREGFVFRNQFKGEKDKAAYEEEYNNLYYQMQQKLYVSGYRIYTSIHLGQQELLQNSIDQALYKFKDKNKEGVYQLQGAAVSIDNDTGRVSAIVGGRSQELEGYTLNRAYQSYRQPGSAVKPLIVYAPAFENGYYPSSIVVDELFEGGPRNAGNSYTGEMELQRAIELSRNTVAWKLFEELTPKVGLSYLINMNFARISKNDYFPAISLGGFTEGVSPLEMASAFATLENDGFYRAPTCIVRIMDSHGNEIVGDEIISQKIYQTNAARMMTEALTGVITKGTAKGYGLANTISAGKTGTTDGQRDGWFVGYTPYYTTSVWVGSDMPKAIEGLKGASYPAMIWHDYMEEIHDKSMTDSFVTYDWRTVLELKQAEEDRKAREEQENEEVEEEISEIIEPIEDLEDDWAEIDEDENLDEATEPERPDLIEEEGQEEMDEPQQHEGEELNEMEEEFEEIEEDTTEEETLENDDELVEMQEVEE